MKKQFKKMFWFLCLGLLILGLVGCGKQEPEVTEEEISLPQASEIGEICELSTLEIYYHNVTKLEKKEKHWLWETQSEVWAEYYGNVKIGIKGNEVSMDIDSETDLVTVTMPEPVVLSVKIDEKSLTRDSFFSDDKGFLKPDITQEEIIEALGDAEGEMKKSAEGDAGIMNQAKKRSEDTIRKYIDNLNQVMGTEYKVTFQYRNAEGIIQNGDGTQ